MTSKSRTRRIKELEHRSVVAKLNALQWLKYARGCVLEQLQLAEDAFLRVAALEKLKIADDLIERNEGLLELVEKSIQEHDAGEQR